MVQGMTRPGTKKPARTSSRIIRELFDIIDASGKTASAIGHPAGIHPITLSYWKAGGRSPRVIDVENVAQVLGYRLKLEPLD
jgi:hypothetical protein